MDLPTVDSARKGSVGLLEVNQDTIASGIVPLYFGANPAAGIPFPAAIVEITPDELDKIQRNELQLPPGWIIRDLIPRPNNGTQP